MVLCINLSVEFSGAAGNLKARFESMAKAGEEVMCKRKRILDIPDTYVELVVDVEVAIICHTFTVSSLYTSSSLVLGG